MSNYNYIFYFKNFANTYENKEERALRMQLLLFVKYYNYIAKYLNKKWNQKY